MATVLTPTLLTSALATPIGPLTLVAFDDRVVAGGFTEDVAGLTARLRPGLRAAPMETVADLGPITSALDAYFAGDLGALDTIPVAPQGGPFQQRVWEMLRTIPPGQPTTYRDIAEKLGGRQLARAVGTANATNPIAPIIPCHRLVGTDGRLRGYYWDLDRKRWLLDHERRYA
jgi:methylated-DNA-[protein]-cysteine S-methyltransferase